MALSKSAALAILSLASKANLNAAVASKLVITPASSVKFKLALSITCLTKSLASSGRDIQSAYLQFSARPEHGKLHWSCPGQVWLFIVVVIVCPAASVIVTVVSGLPLVNTMLLSDCVLPLKLYV